MNTKHLSLIAIQSAIVDLISVEIILNKHDVSDICLTAICPDIFISHKSLL